jgi:hypothetical protein
VASHRAKALDLVLGVPSLASLLVGKRAALRARPISQLRRNAGERVGEVHDVRR